MDLNRSVHNRTIFSQITRVLQPVEKKHILKTYYEFYRKDIENVICKSKKVLHISIHTFTPVLDGIKRKADIGFLYDPARASEKKLIHGMVKAFRSHMPDLTYRRNYPYRGTSDSLTAYLRKKFNDDRYIGIDIEINQQFPESGSSWRLLKERIAETIRVALVDFQWT